MIDFIRIKVQAGNGGDGAVSFFKLKNMRHGKPDGGDGGYGGNIFIEADSGLFDLEQYRNKKIITATNGGNGGKNGRKGKDGGDLDLKVPRGTIVTLSLRGPRSDTLIFDLKEATQKILVARGGNGGKGNSHARFKRDKKGSMANHWGSFNKLKKGRIGEDTEVILELKLLAQVGIIGFPNVGKSTLLSVLTNARPKIGDYPFTTIEPNVGVLEDEDKNKIVAADIPGIIAGAAKGKGLGLVFLRHIERTSLLIHVLDAVSENIISDFRVIREELKLYGHDLEKKKEILVINKIDLADDNKKEQIKNLFKKQKIFFVSAVSGEGLVELKKFIVKLIKQ